MKYTIILTIAAFIAQGLNAQIPKGAMALTGTIGFNGSKNLTEEKDNTTNLTETTWDQTNRGRAIVPAFSYFVSDAIEVGLGLAFINSTTKNDYHPNSSFPGTVKEREYRNPFTGFAILGNYYFKNERKYACYGGLQIGLGGGTGTTETTTVDGTTTKFESKSKGSTFGFNFGLLYFVRHNLALNANFGLLSLNSTTTTSSNNNIDSETKSSNWVVGVNGTIINIGLKFLLNTPAPTPAP
ncbi:MAG: outer membrane beta-barrel protein [Bacteroidia bacterium]|nr:outer membrane beta-barrel protein [Bacteroidia bacterium]